MAHRSAGAARPPPTRRQRLRGEASAAGELCMPGLGDKKEKIQNCLLITTNQVINTQCTEQNTVAGEKPPDKSPPVKRLPVKS